MGSVTCERCGFVSFATSEVCKQCGGTLPGTQAVLHWRPQPQPDWQPQGAADWQQHQTQAGQWPQPAQGWPLPSHGGSTHYGAQQNYYEDDGQPKRKGAAVVSVVCGLLALPVMILGAAAAISLGAPAAILGAVVGLVMIILSFTLGIVGLVRVNRNPFEFGGKGMAIAGVILGSLLLVSVVPIGIITAIAVPNLMLARRAANEATAISTLRTISLAQADYHSAAGEGGYGDLDDLSRQNLISETMAAEVRNGYRFELTASGDSYELTATPVDYPDSGMRSFYVSEHGVIRGADKKGEAADAEDPPISTNGGFADSPASAGGEEIEWTENGPVLRRTGSQSHGRR